MNSNQSNHYSNQRHKREKIIKNQLHGDGYVVKEFIVDKGHKDGKEIYAITNNGIIIISNYDTKKMITKLIARPEQIKKYYRAEDLKAPKWLLHLAQWHKDLHYNK